MQLNDLEYRNSIWKIEPKYSPKVLIGNWYEERMRTDRGFYDLNFNPRWSDRKYGRWEPDVTAEQKTALRNEGNLTNREGAKTSQAVRVSGNYGLKEELQKKWDAPTMLGVSRGRLNTTYSVDYTDWPRRSHLFRMPTRGETVQRTTTSGGIVHSAESTKYMPTMLHNRYDLVANEPVKSVETTTRFSRHLVA